MVFTECGLREVVATWSSASSALRRASFDFGTRDSALRVGVPTRVVTLEGSREDLKSSGLTATTVYGTSNANDSRYGAPTSQIG